MQARTVQPSSKFAGRLYIERPITPADTKLVPYKARIAVLIDRDLKGTMAAIQTQREKIELKYRDPDNHLLYHLLAGTTPNYHRSFDFPETDLSVEKFLESLEAQHGIRQAA